MNNGIVQFDAADSPGDEILELSVIHLEGRLSDRQRDRLNTLLAASAYHRDQFVAVCAHASLLATCVEIDDELDDSRHTISGFEAWEQRIPYGTATEPTAHENITLSPLPSLSTLHPPHFTNFVGGPVFSYMVASVVLCLMLLGAWAYKVTQVAPDRPDVAGQHGQSDLLFVGKVIGMKDCRWANDSTGTMVGASVPMNRQYALSSGLLEIAYAGGARVILEGPCEYTIDSCDGGFLRIGRLVARIEKKVASGEWPVASGEWRVGSGEKPLATAKPQADTSNPQSPIPSPQPLFSVRTPTAVVTDLGTEFGVEVEENGDTTSYVFQGTIKVQGLAGSSAGSAVLQKNESIQASRVRGTHQDQASTDMVRLTHPAESPKFIRRLYEPPKQLDLLDIVAGGNGLGNRREGGVDPQTGTNEPVFYRYPRDESNGYQPVTWHKFIDGVFIPHGGTGPVQADSAGHIFVECPDTEGRTWGTIWSRAADVKEPELAKTTIYWIYAMGRGERFMPEGRGLLCFSSNMGITFDLESIRKTFAGIRPDRFKGTLGMADAHFHVPNPASLADAWVLVDGKVKFKRLGMKPEDAAVNIDVDLEPTDRFLTIVFTDGGNTHAHDWMVIGDPVLELNAD